ncbi:hypothetical protein Aph01nite_24610 [Acrocarpospora phusangensis]|uniref:SMODS and SLOG-associating 2TM effector domain-containing protein n=1 Tax=Acrocarpospora phusangensis TaxID=1070424 RepID=A0A919UJR7_9ACTN|nr:DUF4231 domain-containing protein [Acrocarpospora phusangensis]GIH24151.1 hypothetical protein Aph01nite_24610 [Acrocarpospora phusangensis]
MVIILPILIALWILLTLHVLYPLFREHLHRRRRRADDAARRDLVIPSSVREPTTYAGIQAKSDQTKRAIGDTVDYQGRYRASGIRVAVIPVLAVLFLALQAIFFSTGGPAAIGLAVAQTLLLLILVATVWSNRRPTHGWVASRMKAELFRREHYLLLARTGPYLGLDDGDATAVRDARVGTLFQAGVSELERFAAPANRDDIRGDRLWIDELWATKPPDLPDDNERMQTYLHYRIRRQVLFFRLAIGKCARVEKVLNMLGKIAVLVAVIAAAVYATVLTTVAQPGTPSIGTALLALTSATMPPLCSAALAIQGLYGSQRLAISYTQTRDELLRHENALRRLINEAGPGLRFRAVAIHVETTLTQELMRWVMLVNRPEFEATV